MKRKILITVILVFLALSAAVFVGCGKNELQIPEAYKEGDSGNTQPLENDPQSSLEPQINAEDIEYYEDGFTTTFEEFLIGIKENLSPEVMEEIKELYEEWVTAEKEGDSDKIIEIYETLQDMDVLTMEEQAPMYAFGKKP